MTIGLEKKLHSFEAGRRGKPDELDSNIANLIGAYFLGENSQSRFDLRVEGDYCPNDDTNVIHVSGEVSDVFFSGDKIIPWVRVELIELITSFYEKVHKTSDDKVKIVFGLKPQAQDLASNSNSGDSGNCIAVAFKDSPSNLPWERYIAVGIRDLIDEIYRNGGVIPRGIAQTSGVDRIEGFKADGKVSVDANYVGSKLHCLDDITIAVEHEHRLSLGDLRVQLRSVVIQYLLDLEDQYSVNLGNPSLTINGRGAWNQGGWKVDRGCREAKPQRHYFSSWGVAEDACSGEDPTKPSGTGSFLARYIAVQVVENGLADYANVHLGYTIGQDSVRLNIDTNGTGKVTQEELHKWIKENVSLDINSAIEQFGLRDSRLYRSIVEDSDFFHNPTLPWNQQKLTYENGKVRQLRKDTPANQKSVSSAVM